MESISRAICVHLIVGLSVKHLRGAKHLDALAIMVKLKKKEVAPALHVSVRGLFLPFIKCEIKQVDSVTTCTFE